MKCTHEFSQDRKPYLEDGDHAELSRGAKDNTERTGKFVLLDNMVVERVEYVSKPCADKL